MLCKNGKLRDTSAGVGDEQRAVRKRVAMLGLHKMAFEQILERGEGVSCTYLGEEYSRQRQQQLQ